jgi:hypothetical protein
VLILRYTFFKRLVGRVDRLLVLLSALGKDTADDVAEDPGGGRGGAGGWSRARKAGVACRVVNEGRRVGEPSNDWRTAGLTGEMGRESGKYGERGVVARLLFPLPLDRGTWRRLTEFLGWCW